LRLPAALLAELKALANKRDVPYQSLLKVSLAERVDRERTACKRPPPDRRSRGRDTGVRGTVKPITLNPVNRDPPFYRSAVL
jgi:CopG antitoxin of type II toxin-antitoxin system